MPSKHYPLRQGLLDGAPFIIILAPFSFLFGVFARDLGLGLAECMGFSLGIFAGAAQFASLSLLADNAPLFIAVLAGAALNLRMTLYSAALRHYFRFEGFLTRLGISYILVDQSFSLSDRRFLEKTEWGSPERLRYYFGASAIIAIPWHLFTLLGFLFGGIIGEDWDISFAVPLSFIALIVPALKTRAHKLAAIIGATLSLALYWLPYNTGTLLAAIIAIIAAGQYEARFEDKEEGADA